MKVEVDDNRKVDERKMMTIAEGMRMARDAVQLDVEDFSSVTALEAKLGTRKGCVRVLLPDGMPSWFVMGNKEMREVLAHPDLVRSTDAAAAELLPFLTLANSDFPLKHHLLFADGPDHGRMKSVINKHFTRRPVEKMRPWITDFTNELIDRFIDRGECDYIQELALPLPVAVIGQLLGVAESRRAEFQLRAGVITGVNTSADSSEIAAAGAWFDTFAGELLADRMAAPRDDVMTTMAHAVREGVMTEVEAKSNAFLFLSAGFETTVNLIANGMLALLRHREQIDFLRTHTSQDVTLRAVEELLRYDPAVSGITYRFAARATTVAGVNIAPGEHVTISMPAANHDEDVFTCPAQFDVTREPNPHVAFGFATHFCTGRVLARLEAEIALRATIDRLADLRLAVPDSALTWGQSFTVHRLSALPIQFTAAEVAQRRST